MKTRTVLYAEDGHVLTDGETYGKVLFLSDGADTDSFREITDAEYQAVLAAQAAEAAV